MKKRLMMIASAAVITGTAFVGAAAASAGGAAAVASSGSVLGGGPMVRVGLDSTSNGLPTVAENWSGYAVTSKKPFTFVSSEWIQPAVTCNGTHWVYQAEWVGLDGFDNGTVEQDGTSVGCGRKSGWVTPTYTAWSEMFPAPTIRLFSVKPGDVIQASVTYRNNEFVNTVTDVTSGVTKTVQTAASGQARDSAEWIIERPAFCTNSTLSDCFIVKLANFGSTTMANDVATVGSGKPQKIDTFTNNYPIFMVQPTKSGFYTIDKVSNARPASSSFRATWESYGNKIPINLS